MLRGGVGAHRPGRIVTVQRLGRIVGVQGLGRIISVYRLGRVVGVHRLRGVVDILRRIVTNVLRLIAVVLDRMVVVVGGVGRGGTVDRWEKSRINQFDKDDIS